MPHRNNHIKDFGTQGRQDTVDGAGRPGHRCFGDDLLYTTEIKGVKIGIVGYNLPRDRG
jgi:hypothetical protein